MSILIIIFKFIYLFIILLKTNNNNNYNMSEIYLSDNIIIKDNKTYLLTDNKENLVKKHNWHTILKDIGWEKLDKVWIKQLNKLIDTYPSNSLFGTLECGDDGDCLFHCVAYAINSKQETFYDSIDIRKLVADSINEEQFKDIITCYRSMKDSNDFNEGWNPYNINTLSTFKEELKTSGNNYWCDHIVLQLVCQTFSINIFILTQDYITNTFTKYPMAIDYDNNKESIILSFINDNHFKLIGYFNNTMNTIFTNESLPIEIKTLFNVY